MNTSMKSYLGIEVEVHRSGEIFYGFVAGCDRTVGITIKNIKTEKDLVCINRTQILTFTNNDRKYYYLNRLYHEWFSETIEQIKNGKVFPYILEAYEDGTFKLIKKAQNNILLFEMLFIGFNMTCSF